MIHRALLYRDLREFTAGVCAFVREGLESGDRALVAVPGPRLEPVREALGPDAAAVRFEDMAVLGRNPARLIPFFESWVGAEPDRGARIVGEPVWAERRDCEVVEGCRHEALLNVAFGHTPIAILCPYDLRALGPDVLLDAERTHPEMVDRGTTTASDRYDDPVVFYEAADRELPVAPPDAAAVEVTSDLGRLRAFVRSRAAQTGLEPARVDDLLVAANEAVTNTLVHGVPPARLSVWHDGDSVVCEVVDGGRIADPLVGRRRPAASAANGRGVWLMNQLCDLVELRPTPAGTALRLHMSLAG